MEQPSPAVRLNASGSWFGSSLASLGDIDGDGVSDLAVGVSRDSTGGFARGAMLILFMKADGTVKNSQKIASGTGGGPVLPDIAGFGSAVTSLGDIDADGVVDIAVGADAFDTVGQETGSLYILLLNSDGTAKSSQKIGNGVGGGPGLPTLAKFGKSAATLGDLNGDALVDFAVGGRGDLWILFLETPNIDPVITSPAIANVPENTTHVITATATDADVPSQTVTFSIVGGADQDKFIIGDSRGPIEFSGPINYPNAAFTSAPRINSNGMMVGYFSFPPPPGQNYHTQAFLFDGSNFSTILYPQSLSTLASDINSENVIVGTYVDVQSRSHGYILKDGQFQNFDYPGARHTALGAVSDHGYMVGWYALGQSRVTEHSFLYDGESFTAVRYPNASITYANDVNSDGVVIGWYKDDTSFGRGYSFDGTTYTPIDFPNAIWTIPYGINNEGLIAGTCYLEEIGGTESHGFIFDGTDYRLLDHPEGLSTQLWDVNDLGQVAGIYRTSDTPLTRAFTATISDKHTYTAGLSFKIPPDFEAPGDLNADNVYEVIVQANDGNGGIARQTISVTVTPVNDNAPVFTSPDAVSVLENTISVVMATATDADRPPQTVAYAIVGGADQARFNITPGGALSFKSPPDFEVPIDSNGDNIYIVIVQASDGQLTNLQAILVTVTNGGEGPLLGDYNNNGIVDLADYVLWRNGGPLQNEGASPGAVTQEDYGVWRANFGRTAPGAGQAAVLAGESHPMSTDSESEGLTEQLAMRNSQSVDGQSFALPAEREARLARATVQRPSRRNGFAPDARDDAIVAWLASRRAGREHQPLAHQLAGGLHETSSRHEAARSTDAFELAFAAIGTSGVATSGVGE